MQLGAFKLAKKLLAQPAGPRLAQDTLNVLCPRAGTPGLLPGVLRWAPGAQPPSVELLLLPWLELKRLRAYAGRPLNGISKIVILNWSD